MKVSFSGGNFAFRCISMFLFVVMYQGVIKENVEECKLWCDSIIGCHGYVFISDDEENEVEVRSKCFLKFGNVSVNGTSVHKTTANLRFTTLREWDTQFNN